MVGTFSSHIPGPDLEQDLPYGTFCTTWYVVVPSPPRPYPTWTVCHGGDEGENRDVGKEVKFGESKGGGQKGNSGGGGDGGSNDEDNNEECKDGKGDADEADLDSFLGNINKGYSHCEPKNHQNNIYRLNEEIVLRSKMDIELSDTRKELIEAQKREVDNKSFLDRLLKRLVEVEKASLTLRDFLKRSSRRRAKAATAATTDSSVATVPSAHLLIGTKRSECISAALNFPAPLYTLLL